MVLIGQFVLHGVVRRSNRLWGRSRWTQHLALCEIHAKTDLEI